MFSLATTGTLAGAAAVVVALSGCGMMPPAAGNLEGGYFPGAKQAGAPALPAARGAAENRGMMATSSPGSAGGMMSGEMTSGDMASHMATMMGGKSAGGASGSNMMSATDMAAMMSTGSATAMMGGESMPCHDADVATAMAPEAAAPAGKVHAGHH